MALADAVGLGVHGVLGAVGLDTPPGLPGRGLVVHHRRRVVVANAHTVVALPLGWHSPGLMHPWRRDVC